MNSNLQLPKQQKLPSTLNLLDIDGMLLFDKPTGLSSNKALQQVKRLFKAKKAGHTGNLDPLASGILPICFGEATKFAGYLLDADKTYEVTAELGVTTDTGDADGSVITTTLVPCLTTEYLQHMLLDFCGAIEQLPPMYSALKYHGQPLYKLARKGIAIERTVRKVMIYKLELLSFNAPYISLRVQCSKGTYIRTLIEDFGKKIGCGATVIALRRIKIGYYTIDDTLSLDNLRSNLPQDLLSLLLPVDSALQDWPAAYIADPAVACFVKGQEIMTGGSYPIGSIKVYAKSNGRFLGIGEVMTNGGIAPKRLIHSTKLPLPDISEIKIIA